MNYEEFYNKVAELVKQAENMHNGEEKAVGGRCAVHTWNDEPVVLKAYEKKAGGTYYAHKRNFGTAEEPDWKVCFGKGWLESKK